MGKKSNKKKAYNWEEDYEIVEDEGFEPPASQQLAGIGADEFVGDAVETVKSAAEGLKDAAITAPQSYSMESLDDIIEGLAGKETAEKYRETIRSARERSPIATTIGEMAVPNPLQKLGMIQKLGKMAPAALDAATSAAFQMGDRGEVSGWETAANVGFGAGARKAGGLFKDFTQSRAKMLNIGDITRFEPKAKGLTKATGKYADIVDYSDELMTKLSKDRDYFRSGAVDFDPDTLKFTPVSTGKKRHDLATMGDKKSLMGTVGRAKLAPGSRELVKRNVEASSKVASDVRDELSQYSHMADSHSPNLLPDDPAIVTAQGLEAFDENRLLDIINSETLTPQESSRVSKSVNEIFDGMFGEYTPHAPGVEMSGGRLGATDLSTLNRKKSMIYDKLQGEYEKTNTTVSEKGAMKDLARLFKDYVNHATGGKIAHKNAFLEEMATVREGLSKKISFDYAEATPDFGSTSVRRPEFMVGDRMFRAMDKVRPAITQAAEEVYTDPRIRRRAQDVRSTFLPKIMTGGEQGDVEYQGRSPQSISASMETIPKQLQAYRLPRTVEGLKAEKKMVLAKVAQEMPEHFDDFQYIFEKKPEDIPELLRMMMDLMPRAFDKDKYSRVDNEVPPELRGGLTEDIKHNKELSNLDKIEKIDTLNREGKYYDN